MFDIIIILNSIGLKWNTYIFKKPIALVTTHSTLLGVIQKWRHETTVEDVKGFRKVFLIPFFRSAW